MKHKTILTIILLISSYIGLILGSIGIAEMLPGRNTKTPIWAWILTMAGFLLCAVALYLLFYLSNVKIFN